MKRIERAATFSRYSAEIASFAISNIAIALPTFACGNATDSVVRPIGSNFRPLVTIGLSVIAKASRKSEHEWQCCLEHLSRDRGRRKAISLSVQSKDNMK